MAYSSRIVNQLASVLLKWLRVKSPTPEQCEAAAFFIRRVILPVEEKTNRKVLSPKEWVCLNLAASGFSTEETADQMALAKGTIKNYREKIRQKLHCKSITEAVYKAFINRS